MSQATRLPAKAIFLFLVLIMLFLSSGGKPVVQAQGGTPPELFSQVAAPADAGPLEQGEVRSAYVNVDMGLLFDASGKARERKTLPAIKLNLFPDVNYIGVVTKVVNSTTSTKWVGRLKGMQVGYFYIVVVGDIIEVHIASLDGIYDISWNRAGIYKVAEINQSQLGDEAAFPESSSFEMNSISEVSVRNVATPPTIDVMIFYTEQARDARGGDEQMQAHIEMGIEQANNSYENSGVLTRLRLVHAEAVNFPESGSVKGDMALLANSPQKWIKDFNHLREIYGADMVALIIKEKWDSEYCGMAWGIYPRTNNVPDSSHFFQVTKSGHCMTDEYTLAHEFGHLQGARHDLYSDSAKDPFAYGHGYVYMSGLKSWRTMMATYNKCDESLIPRICPRLLYWSNPNLKMGGQPMGVVGQSENYRVLNETAPIIAAFYPTQVSDDFFSDFGIRYGGWSAVSGNWKIANGTYSTGTDGYFNSVKHTGKYVDFKYEAMLKRTVARYNANNIIIRGDTSSLSGAKEWKSEYAFQYSNDGTFSVWKTDKNGTKTPLKPWTAHSVIRPYDWNKLTVHAIGNRFTFLINNTRVWSGVDSSLIGGEVGIGRWNIESRPNEFLINWVELTNYIYTDVMADSLADQEIVSGVELSGGTIDSSPQR